LLSHAELSGDENGVVGWCVVLAQLTHLGVLRDFLVLYLQAQWNGLVLVLGSVASSV
jgi:hypothetical protein